ncbi:olfactory receptor 52D1-like [Protopterus annectens]|uniref:olfactory receptor 52D1-like n=1 Tax=Protopterus annectens TaxID=7888 RepID=UPI001CF9AEF1|nr:olfactory receptor 52D1-like [Protopterus annectens]
MKEKARDVTFMPSIMIMPNSSTTSVIQLHFEDLGNVSYLLAFCLIILYTVTLFINIFLILLVVFKDGLQEPMFIFSSNLFLNGVIASSAFLPKFTADILSETKTISLLGCFCQMFFIHFFNHSELSLLTVMSYDRYVAICNPLRYLTIMNVHSICRLLSFKNCDHFSILKLSCADYTINNSYGVVTIVFSASLLFFIAYSYVQIIHVCLQSSKESHSKALQICFTHLMIVLVYLVGVLFMVVQHRLPSNNLPPSLYIFMSIEFLIVTPLTNPIIYGLRTNKIKVAIVQFFYPDKKRTHLGNTQIPS